MDRTIGVVVIPICLAILVAKSGRRAFSDCKSSMSHLVVHRISAVSLVKSKSAP